MPVVGVITGVMYTFTGVITGVMYICYGGYYRCNECLLWGLL